MKALKKITSQLLVLVLMLHVTIVPPVVAQTAVTYSHTIDMTTNSFDFYTDANPKKSLNETFSTSTAANFAQLAWDDNHLYIGYQSKDLQHYSNGDVNNKWMIAYFGIPGVSGTTTGINYNGQEPSLPFQAKYHLRFKAGNNNYTSLEVFNGTSWTFSKEYKWVTDMQRDTSSNLAFWKIRIPKADLGLTNAKSLQFVSSMLYEAQIDQAMWASMPNNAFTNGDGFDRNFSTFYEFDLFSDATAPAAQQYLYDLKVGNIAWNAVDVTFAAQTGATKLAVEQSADNGVTWTESTTGAALTASSTSATITGLNPTTAYKFRLKVTGGPNQGSSVIVNAVTPAEPPDTQAPTVPQNVTASSVTATGANVSWNASTDNKAVTEYEVYRNETLVATVNSTSHGLTGLQENTTYSISVRAKDAAGNRSAASSALTLKTLDVTAPAAPGGLLLSELSPTGFKVEWSVPADNAGVTGYDVFVNAGFVANTAVNSYIFSGLTPNTAYSVTVKAKDAAGNVSADSQPLAAQTPSQSETEPPTAPTELAATGITSTGFNMSWKPSTDNVGVVSYEVYNNGQLVSLVKEPRVVFTGLSGGTEYRFSVKARDAAGNVSLSSAELPVKTPDTLAPTAPGSLSSSDVTATGFRLTWVASTDDVAVKEYEIYLDGKLHIKVSGTSYSFGGLISRITYQAGIQAVDAAGNKSPLSALLKVTTLGQAPYSNTISFVDNKNHFVPSTNLDKAKIETFATSTPLNTGYVTWDADHIYLGYSSADIAHLDSLTEKKWLIAYFGIPGVGGSKVGVNYSGQQPNLPFAALYHLRFQTGNTNYTSLEMFDGKEWKTQKEYKWLTDMTRDPLATPAFWKIKIPRKDLSLDNAQSFQFAMSMLYESALSPSMWGAVPADAFDAAGADKDFLTYHHFDLTAGQTASAAQTDLYQFKAVAASSQSVNATFKAMTGSSAVHIHMSDDDGISWRLANVSQPLTATSTAATITGLVPDSDYLFKLVATDGTWAGSSALQDVKTPPPPDETAPSTPTGLKADEVMQTTVKLSWTAATDNVGVKRYEIFRETNILDRQKVGESETAGFLATGLKEETTYTFSIVAVDAAGNRSALGAGLQVKTLAVPATVTIHYKRGFATPHIFYRLANVEITTSPGLPLTPSTKFPGYSSITILLNQEKAMVASFTDGSKDEVKWDRNAPNSYRFEKGEYTYVPNEKATLAGEILTGTPDMQPPTAPTQLRVQSKTANSLTLVWNAATDNNAVRSYIVYRNNLKIATVNSTTFTDRGLQTDTFYSYRVIARDAYYNLSAPSAEGRFSVNDSIYDRIDRTTNLTRTVAVINGEMLVNRMRSGNFTIDLSSEQPVVRAVQFEVPATALRTIATAQPRAILTFRTSFGSLEMPVSSLNLPVIAGNARTIVNSLNMIFIIQRTDINVNADFKNLLTAQAANMVMDAVAFRIIGESMDNRRSRFELRELPRTRSTSSEPQMYHYVTRVIELPRSVNIARASVISYHPEAKTTQFVPALFEIRNNRQVAVIRSPLTGSMTITESARNFRDLPQRVKRDIEFLAAKGVVRGTTLNTFSPENPVTRAQFAALLVRSLGLLEDPLSANFNDMKDAGAFRGAIGTAAKTGLIRGTAGGSFSPNAEITRAEVAVIIDRAMTYANRPVTITNAEIQQLLADFTDRELIPVWAAPSVAKLMKIGIIQPNTWFDPLYSATRADVALMLKGMLEHLNYLNKLT